MDIKVKREMMKVKGIVLAGGSGTRLFPMTHAVSKHLLPIYDKPLVYYPISVLMLASIDEILIISTPNDIPVYERLLGDGSKLGVKFSYMEQEKPRGIAEAFILAEDFIGDDKVCLILGDNIFYGQDLTQLLNRAKSHQVGATIFGYRLQDVRPFGVVEFDDDYNVLSIEEKPEHPKSNYAVPGLYFYDSKVVEIAKSVEPSARGELEITSVNNAYLERNELKVVLLGRGMAWMDAGNPDSMLHASEYIQAIQSRQGLYISCLEEIAWRRGFITKEELRQRGEELKMTHYGQYILSLLED